MTFNYRYSPKHQKIKELLLAGEIGKVTSVDFSWYLDTSPRRRLLPPLAPPAREERLALGPQGHAPLRPRQLVARRRPGRGLGLRRACSSYGKKGPFRHTHCRPCPHKAKCAFHWDITKNPRLVSLYADCEKADGYLRDGCVFKEDVDISDTMNAVVRYSTGVSMSYSVNAFMPIEGYRLAFNGTKGRLEVRDYERQPWAVPEETEMHVDPELRRAREDRDPEGRGRPRRRRRRAARPDLPRSIDAARPPAPAGLARGRHVVPHRHRGPQEHGRAASR